METKEKSMEDVFETLRKKVAGLSAKYGVDAEIVARLMLHCKDEAELEGVLKDWHEGEDDEDWNESEK